MDERANENAMKRLYFDNAATSFPKPSCVMEAMVRYGEEIGASAGRGAYAEAQESGRIIAECRERINTLIGGESANHVIFTMNASDALNMAIRGLAARGYEEHGCGHAITTYMEHNSVLRPLNELVRKGMIEQTRVKCDPRTGLVNVDDIKNAIQDNTRFIAVIHGSNVTGTIQPIAQIGNICRNRGIPFVVDGAQTAGHVPIDVTNMNIDFLAMPGHKGLLGPLGTGVLYIRPGMENWLATIREGGTGSVSELDTQPEFLPDRFEPGSHNAIGIAGLNASVGFLLDNGVASVREHEEELMREMMEALDGAGVKGLEYFGPREIANRCGVFSVRIKGMEPGELARRLEKEYGILTRPGLHCAPLAHQTIGTFEGGGTTRLSFGYFTTVEDVRFTAEALCRIAKGESTSEVRTGETPVPPVNVCT